MVGIGYGRGGLGRTWIDLGGGGEAVSVRCS